MNFFNGGQIEVDENVFGRGMDSLQAMKLLRFVTASLREVGKEQGCKLTPRAIYQRPTASAMAKMLMQGEGVGGEEGDDSLGQMQRLLNDYTRRIDRMEKQVDKKSSSRNVGVLTGSTGSLSSYFLDALIRSSAVDKVVCLNGSGGDSQKQLKTMQSRGLCQDFSRVEFLGVMDCMDWIPVDVQGEVLVEAVVPSHLPSHKDEGRSCNVLHFVNPRKSYCEDVVGSLIEKSGMKVVPCAEWLRELVKAAEREDVERVPAVKLIGFFQEI
ncbi:uncharacterized protein LTR77_003329 [Saxophila tyrrhenica]|uniref:Carrier domain-containing protein n=1 Tax=Saxophila tyrrhenica TaxID=1690608 RepID=A0AAV9PK79_9PEZI|nr:hypothetical protein LTR77_003329 [Saxophila tyrrhenica]